MTPEQAFPQEIIRHKRDGKSLSPAEIEAFVRGLTDGSWSEGQVAAMAMAVFFRGMSMDERIALTRAMTVSGSVMRWSDAGLPGPIVDKHSTGGVGDKVSLVLAPILAACGAVVPMISGRGLGHTGGTLDKLESFPGYDPYPSNDRFAAVLRDVGCAIIGQTSDLAPADRRFYAIRDVTATVESIPLITASILSKKLAAGLQRLVMDVKFGTGAFADSFAMADELARSIVEVSTGAGLPCTALITDMNEVLGRTAGNSIEVLEAIDVLTGGPTESRLWEVTEALAVELLVHTGLFEGPDEARTAIARARDSGAAAERFEAMVAALGGPAKVLTERERVLPLAPIEVDVEPTTTAVVCRMDVRALGIVVMGLGGGRHRADDRIDHGVGLADIVGLGSEVGPGRPLCRVIARSPDAAETARRAVLAAIEVGPAAPDRGPVIARRIGPGERPAR